LVENLLALTYTIHFKQSLYPNEHIHMDLKDFSRYPPPCLDSLLKKEYPI